MLLYSGIILFLCIAIVAGLPEGKAWAAQIVSRIVVIPIFFIPKDANVSDQELSQSADLLQSYLRHAQQKYKTLLETDTFMLSDRKINFYRAAKDNAYYNTFQKQGETDVSHVIAKELLDWNRDNRMDTRGVYLTIYVRPNNQPSGVRTFGGGRTFNGPPNSGGGYVELERTSLLRDTPYPFQSTLVHELGHAFGLTHVDCLGYNLSTNHSIMSYNPQHHTRGPMASAGGLNPEEYYILSLNKLAFPNFTYNEARHNPQRKSLANVERCFLGPMGTYIGAFRQIPGKGYELFHNGRLVSGPEASFYTWSQAQQNCKYNVDNNRSNIKIECRYNGQRFYPATR